MKILMMGPQGSGKGTVGGMIAELLGIPLLSTGKILRSISPEHRWYSEINDQMKRGELVDQQKVAKLLEEELSKEIYVRGFVLDGWYRSMKDVAAYEVDLDRCFLLTISEDTTIKRLGSRRTCSVCGEIFSTLTPSKKPKVEGICDKCGGALTLRKDDTDEAIMRRLKIFKEETSGVIKHLESKGILTEIDGEGPPEEVLERIKGFLV